jgi:hypothetical protein
VARPLGARRLGLAWCYPGSKPWPGSPAPEVVARLAGAGPAATLLGDASLADVTADTPLTRILVTALLGWGSYTRWRG